MKSLTSVPLSSKPSFRLCTSPSLPHPLFPIVSPSIYPRKFPFIHPSPHPSTPSTSVHHAHSLVPAAGPALCCVLGEDGLESQLPALKEPTICEERQLQKPVVVNNVFSLLDAPRKEVRGGGFEVVLPGVELNSLGFPQLGGVGDVSRERMACVQWWGRCS